MTTNVADSLAYLSSAELATETQTAERFLTIIRARLQTESSNLPTGMVKQAVAELKDVTTVQSFNQKTRVVFRGCDMSAALASHRYAIHMLGALKGILEILESFRERVQSNKQDHRPVKANSPQGHDVVCWIMLRGHKNNDRRVTFASTTICLAMALLEAKNGRLLVTKTQKGEAAESKGNEETSHRCHQALCVKPAHVTAEVNVANFRRINCGALATCHHNPQCLLPHRDVRKDQYPFVKVMTGEHDASSPYKSRQQPKKKQRTA